MPKNSVQVVAKNEETKQFKLAVGELEEILLQDDVKDREIVVISIAGAFRKGKSFMLNFFLKYLNEVYVKKSLINDWLGSGDDSLNGFKWCGGVRRVTTGIHMWNETFTHDYDDGRKVAIVLLDTQGTFDSRTTMKDCTTIFALSTLLSSVQIFNVMQQIQEDDLQHLQLFSEYGRLAAKSGDAKPLQNLTFLVRDWNCPYDFSYGLDGGLEYLKDCFHNSDDQEQEHRSLRSHIISCYDSIDCFLMPFPGKNVSFNQNFDGKLNDIDKDFIGYLRLLVPHFLAPENLIVKKINGFPIKAYEFLEYFKHYCETFRCNEMPAPMTLMEANATVHNKLTVERSKNHYSSKMKPLDATFQQDIATLTKKHDIAKEEVFEILVKTPLIGANDIIAKFKNELETFIETELQKLMNKNGQKYTVKRMVGLIAVIATSVAAVSIAAVPVALSIGGAEGTVTAMAFIGFLFRLFGRQN